MASYRRFTQNDWDAFAGAEPFPNGSQPLIYERALNDGLVGLTIIIDRTGIEVRLFGKEVPDEQDEDNFWCKTIEGLTSIRARGELELLIKYLERFTYAPDLAYELDHPCDPITEGFEFC